MIAMKRPYLRRYMAVRHAEQLLRTRKLAFLDPNKWNDRNDAYLMQAYREVKGLRAVLAVCFTQVSERHHHWERFGSRVCPPRTTATESDDVGTELVCVEFDKKTLLEALRGDPGIRSAAVTYQTLKELESAPPRLATWPFLKRLPYKDEQEFRIIYESQKDVRRPHRISIDIHAIRRIVIGPYASPDRRDEIKRQIQAIRLNRDRIEVTKTTILDNTRWHRIIARARDASHQLGKSGKATGGGGKYRAQIPRPG
jgi:hypothetical protein